MIRFREDDIKYIAVELPDEVKFYKFSGDFEEEEKTVLRLLEGELPIPLRRRLELELEICREMQRDYYTDFDTLLSRIREKYPACTAENRHAHQDAAHYPPETAGGVSTQVYLDRTHLGKSPRLTQFPRWAPDLG